MTNPIKERIRYWMLNDSLEFGGNYDTLENACKAGAKYVIQEKEETKIEGPHTNHYFNYKIFDSTGALTNYITYGKWKLENLIVWKNRFFDQIVIDYDFVDPKGNRKERQGEKDEKISGVKWAIKRLKQYARFESWENFQLHEELIKSKKEAVLWKLKSHILELFFSSDSISEDKINSINKEIENLDEKDYLIGLNDVKKLHGILLGLWIYQNKNEVEFLRSSLRPKGGRILEGDGVEFFKKYLEAGSKIESHILKELIENLE